MAVEGVTRKELRRRLAGAMQDDIVRGTNDGDTTLTVSDAQGIANFAADSLNGTFVRINGGTGAGQERPVVDSSGSLVTAAYLFSPTLDNTSTFEIHRKFSAAQYDDAIDQAIRRSRWSHLRQIRRRALLSGTRVVNPLFTDWNAAASVPDGWESSGIWMQQVLVNPYEMVGKTVNIKMLVWSNGAESPVFDIANETGSFSTLAVLGGGWALLEGTITLTSADGTEIIKIGSGGIKTLTAWTRVPGIVGPYALRGEWSDGSVIIFDYIWIESDLREYKLEPDDADGTDLRGQFDTIDTVRLSTAAAPTEDPTMMEVSQHKWDIAVDTDANRVVFSDALPAGRLIELVGMGTENVGGDDDDVLRINAEVVELYALYRLCMISGEFTKAQLYLDQWTRLRNETRTNWPAYSRQVRNGQ